MCVARIEKKSAIYEAESNPRQHLQGPIHGFDSEYHVRLILKPTKCNLKKHSHPFKGQELPTYPAETRQDDKRDKKDLSEMALT